MNNCGDVCCRSIGRNVGRVAVDGVEVAVVGAAAIDVAAALVTVQVNTATATAGQRRNRRNVHLRALSTLGFCFRYTDKVGSTAGAVCASVCVRRRTQRGI
jgi:hypothetical protein